MIPFIHRSQYAIVYIITVFEKIIKSDLSYNTKINKVN